LSAGALHDLNNQKLAISIVFGNEKRTQAYKGLFIEGAMLLLPFDVGKPWLDTTGIAEQILFIHGILIGLLKKASVQATAVKSMGAYDQVKVRPGRR
jgi:hypothetical protein